MNSIKILIIIPIILVFIFFSSEILGQDYCKTKSPSQSRKSQVAIMYQQWLSNGGLNSIEGVIAIPIAFHIILRNDGFGDVSDEVIDQQLNVLNSRISSLGFRFTKYSVDRTYNTSWFNHSPESPEEVEMKTILAINPLQILNFYICNLDGTYGGYAHFPESFDEDSKMHGVVVRYTTLPGGNEPYYNKGITAVHEVGHYLGLFHTFEGGCYGDGDFVEDTPYQYVPGNLFCLNQDSCPDRPGDDPIDNYMDYSNDDCRVEFTTGQRAYSHFKMQTFRRTIYFGISNTTKDVTIEQKLYNSNNNIGQVGVWDNGLNKFDYISVPKNFPLPLGSTKHLISSDNLISSQKYYQWELNNAFYDLINQNDFTINNNTNNITSRFNQTYPNIVIRNRIDNMHFNDSLAISFKDPWLIDYPDPLYGNTLSNRGMDAPFKQRPSPFYPDYTTSYNGDVYKGVFLNQEIAPNKPYYSVKADYLQTFILSQTGRTHKFYFQGWSASPQGSAEFQNANALETPVVFKQSGATVQANYKGTQLSNNSVAYSKASQRKFIKTPDGVLHSVYESLNKVWYERSTDNGSTWFIVNNGQPLSNNDSKNPSLSFYGNEIYIVWQEKLVIIIKYNW
jgi:hypothetical protein